MNNILCVFLLFQAEQDLYYKSGQLVSFLHGWRGRSASLAGRYEELMVELFERGYIEEQVRAHKADTSAVRGGNTLLHTWVPMRGP